MQYYSRARVSYTLARGLCHLAKDIRSFQYGKKQTRTKTEKRVELS